MDDLDAKASRHRGFEVNEDDLEEKASWQRKITLMWKSSLFYFFLFYFLNFLLGLFFPSSSSSSFNFFFFFVCLDLAVSSRWS